MERLEDPRLQNAAKKALFFCSMGRNALVVMMATLLAFAMDGTHQPFTLTGGLRRLQMA